MQTNGNSGRALPRRLRHWLLGANPRNDNIFMRHLLGRELRTMQLSVRHRIKRFVNFINLFWVKLGKGIYHTGTYDAVRVAGNSSYMDGSSRGENRSTLGNSQWFEL